MRPQVPRGQRISSFYVILYSLCMSVISCSISSTKCALWVRGGDSKHEGNQDQKAQRFQWPKNRTKFFKEPEDNQESSTRKLEFLDRIALISQSLLKKERDASLLPAKTESDYDFNQTESDILAITPQSDLTIPERYIHVVTTAALPWFTGTAVNPLLRAAYLHRQTQQYSSKEPWVTLVVPWLELPHDQQTLYNKVFQSQQEQERFIRDWLREEAKMSDVADPVTGLQILFYPARYHSGLRSVFAMGDIMSYMDPNKMDVCVLEEPEHCNWFRCPGDGWTKRFQYVIGIVHTSKCKGTENCFCGEKASSYN